MLEKKFRIPSFYFKKIYQKGRVVKGRFVTLRLLENPEAIPRFGIVIRAKTIKKATKRNLIKRRLTGIIRSRLFKIKPGFDFVFIIKEETSFKELEEDIKRLLNV